MMILVPVIFVFTISLCNANHACHYYNEPTRSLKILCVSQDIVNCSQYASATHRDPLDILAVKIENCHQVFIGDATARYIHMKRLDISNSGYKELNWRGIPLENADTFEASGNYLTVVPTSILGKFPKLRTLVLANNRLEKISAGDFETINPKVNRIVLSKNRLKSIDAGAFANFSEPFEIDLSKNSFSTVPVDIFKTNVSSVNLIENPGLNTFDCSIIKSIGTKGLNITWEYITTFDGSCINGNFILEHGPAKGIAVDQSGNVKVYCDIRERCLKNTKSFVAGPGANVNEMLRVFDQSVEKIDLTGYHLNELNATTFARFPNLQELILSDTGLKEFDFHTLNLRDLKHLDISKNNLKKVEHPTQLQNYRHMTHLNVAGNQIENINEILQYLPPSVRHLTLTGNPWNNVSDNCFERFPALQHLNVSYSNRPIRTESFKPLRNLESLDVSKNIVYGNFPELQSMYRLKEFRASNCLVNNITELIQYLRPSVVERLDLSGNTLEGEFNLKSFDRFKNLKELDLSDVRLEEEVDVSPLPSSLERLVLRRNGFDRIENLDRKHFPALNVLDIADNPLDCKYLDKLKLEFKDANINAECSSKFWIILLAILAVLVVLILLVLCCLWICPKICK